MWFKRVSAGLIVAAIGVVSVATLAAATESFDDGYYTLVLPGVGDFDFEINSGGNLDGETVIAMAAPDGYFVDDDDPDKAAWKDAATLSLEVEIKSDKVEGDYDWADGPATLMLPGGGITVTYYTDGNFDVGAWGGWWAFGSRSDWFVANDDRGDWDGDTVYFKVEADEYGIEIKPTYAPDDGFLNDLDDEEEEELEEIELEEDEGEGGGESRGRGRN